MRPPVKVTGCGVVRVEETPDTKFSAGNACDNLVFDNQRCRCLAIPTLIGRHFFNPLQIAGSGVDGCKLGVERAHVECLAQDCDTTVVPTAADSEVVR